MPPKPPGDHFPRDRDDFDPLSSRSIGNAFDERPDPLTSNRIGMIGQHNGIRLVGIHQRVGLYDALSVLGFMNTLDSPVDQLLSILHDDKAEAL